MADSKGSKATGNIKAEEGTGERTGGSEGKGTRIGSQTDPGACREAMEFSRQLLGAKWGNSRKKPRSHEGAKG